MLQETYKCFCGFYVSFFLQFNLSEDRSNPLILLHTGQHLIVQSRITLGWCLKAISFRKTSACRQAVETILLEPCLLVSLHAVSCHGSNVLLLMNGTHTYTKLHKLCDNYCCYELSLNGLLKKRGLKAPAKICRPKNGTSFVYHPSCAA